MSVSIDKSRDNGSPLRVDAPGLWTDQLRGWSACMNDFVTANSEK
jgi:hypothetical protein